MLCYVKYTIKMNGTILSCLINQILDYCLVFLITRYNFPREHLSTCYILKIAMNYQFSEVIASGIAKISLDQPSSPRTKSTLDVVEFSEKSSTRSISEFKKYVQYLNIYSS